MFEGEFESLKAIHETCTVKVPKPVKVVKTLSRYWNILSSVCLLIGICFFEFLSYFRNVMSGVYHRQVIDEKVSILQCTPPSYDK